MDHPKAGTFSDPEAIVEVGQVHVQIKGKHPAYGIPSPGDLGEIAMRSLLLGPVRLFDVRVGLQELDDFLCGCIDSFDVVGITMNLAGQAVDRARVGRNDLLPNFLHENFAIGTLRRDAGGSRNYGALIGCVLGQTVDDDVRVRGNIYIGGREYGGIDNQIDSEFRREVSDTL